MRGEEDMRGEGAMERNLGHTVHSVLYHASAQTGVNSSDQAARDTNQKRPKTHKYYCNVKAAQAAQISPNLAAHQDFPCVPVAQSNPVHK